MTLRGANLLRAELHKLKTVERPANSQAIGEARAHGDLSENAEYHAARERAGFIEGRIAEIESKLANAQIVGEDEADIKAGRISYSSPIGKALIGKEAGEEVEVQTPGGLKRYEIIDVRYE